MLLLAPLLLMAAEDKVTPSPKEDGFVPLFDGKTLKGWVPVNAAPDTFFVKDGMLVTTGVPTGFLRTEKRYENFVLECEYMHMKAKGNSGIFVWADPLPAVGSPFTRAIEVQVLDGLETKNYTSHGDVFAIWGAKFVPDREHPGGWMRCLPSEKRAKPAGEWNHYRIECNDGSIKLAVNGKVVSGGTKSNPRFGYIALEAEGSECRYRNLRLKELPSTKPKPEESCPEAKGHKTLFTGIDLKGWEAAPKEDWKVNSGANILACVRKQKEGNPSRISQEISFAKNQELIMDIKAPRETRIDVGFGKKVSDPLAFAGSKRFQLPTVTIEQTAETAGKWQRYVFTTNDPNEALRVTRDGKPLTGGVRPTGNGRLEIQVDGPAEFTNVFLRPLRADELPKDGVK
jgi:hypothetical protein